MFTFAYPICLFRKLLTKMSSTEPSSSCLSPLLVVLYCLYSLGVLANCRRMFAICGPVLEPGMTGSGPEFTGGINLTRLRALYTAVRTVMNRRPRAPSLKYYLTEAELVLS